MATCITANIIRVPPPAGSAADGRPIMLASAAHSRAFASIDWRVGTFLVRPRAFCFVSFSAGSQQCRKGVGCGRAGRCHAPVREESLESFYAARANRPLLGRRLRVSDAAPQILMDLCVAPAPMGWIPILSPQLGPRGSHPPVQETSMRSTRPTGSSPGVRRLRPRSRRTPKIEMIWVDAELRPSAPSPPGY